MDRFSDSPPLCTDSYGYDTGYISGVKEMNAWVRIFGKLQADGTYALSSGTNSLVTSILSAGTFVGKSHFAASSS
jgi:hypothetical protein